MNGRYYSEIVEAAANLNCPVELYQKPIQLLDKVENLYTNRSQHSIWLWEKLIDCLSVHGDIALESLELMPLPTNIILFFNKFEDETMILLKDSSQILKIIRDCIGFEFYLTDESTRFLICYNHHDILSGSGSAKNWLSSLKKANKIAVS